MLSRKLVLLLFAVSMQLVLAADVRPASAGSFSTFSSANTYTLIRQVSGGEFITGTDSASASVSFTEAHAEASVNTEIGRCAGLVSGTVIVAGGTDLRDGISAGSQAYSRWRDTFTISSPTDPTGGRFEATFEYALIGTMFNSGDGGGCSVGFELSYDPDDQGSIGEQSTGEFIRHQVPGKQNIDQTGVLFFEFDEGVPFEFEAELQLNADFGSRSAGNSVTDFTGGVVITSVILPKGFLLSSASGTNYPAGCTTDADCDDGDLCTDDTCDPAIGCENIPNFDDENDCTDDSCDPQTGQASHVPTAPGTACDDGLECTEADECDGDGACAGTRIRGCMCPFGLALERDSQRKTLLGTLYDMRDHVLSQSVDGSRYVELFYHHAGEVTRLLLVDPALRASVETMLQRYIPVLERRLAGEDAVLTAADLQAIGMGMRRLAAKAGVELNRDLEALEVALREGRLTRLLGIRVDKKHRSGPRTR